MFRSISGNSLSAAVFALFFCLSTTYGQQRFSAGPRVGLNLSTLRGDVNGYKLTPGLVAGAFLMYSSLNHFGISADVLYSQRGGKFSGVDPGNIPVEFKQQINYIEIPVALRYFLTLDGAFRPNIFFGPSLALPMSAKRINAKRGGIDQSDGTNSDAFKNADLGVLAGFQLNWPGFGQRQRFLVDARYTLGLGDVTSLPIAGGTGLQNIKNSTITLTLGYGFGVGPEYRSRFNR
ncbi:PorT family protein [Spirosoma taeanense]|uniref:PorT family protein n=1 Tax=Spirosoma taeanense TaxID=2735870 RepID=A0A6M5Y425_9BACT|nr:porin family protein [Spirosoma taeanense]QJW88144.1 PorT family protein [Spirosoma taeanense]